MFAIKQAFPLVETHGSASTIAYILECLVDLISGTRAAFVAKGIPSIKIEGMTCMRNVCANKMGYANRELHRSVGV